MLNLGKEFTKAEIEEPVVAEFELAWNVTRLSSFNAQMCFTDKKVYLVPFLPNDILFFDAIAFEYSEVVSYGRKLLAGYEIHLADGSKVSLANVFGKMRAAITEELDYHCKEQSNA